MLHNFLIGMFKPVVIYKEHINNIYDDINYKSLLIYLVH